MVTINAPYPSQVLQKDLKSEQNDANANAAPAERHMHASGNTGETEPRPTTVDVLKHSTL